MITSNAARDDCEARDVLRSLPFTQRVEAGRAMAFVTVLHLPAERKSMLPEILSRWTSMPVKEGLDGTLIEPNCVYVPPPHALITFADGRLSVRPAKQEERVYRPIDGFLQSAERRPPRMRRTFGRSTSASIAKLLTTRPPTTNRISSCIGTPWECRRDIMGNL